MEHTLLTIHVFFTLREYFQMCIFQQSATVIRTLSKISEVPYLFVDLTISALR
jgi:hypothetical protein